LATNLTFPGEYVRLNSVRPSRLQDALENLTAAIRQVETAVQEMRDDMTRSRCTFSFRVGNTETCPTARAGTAEKWLRG
jgi:hypothetical protein